MRALALLALAAAAALLAGACASSPRVPTPAPAARRELAVVVHGDTRFHLAERLLAEAAAADLERFTRGRARFLLAWDLDDAHLLELASSPRLVRAPGLAPVLDLADSFARGKVKGWVDPGPPLVVYVVPERCAELYPVLLHELGHAAGFADLEDVPAVMRRDGAAWTFTRHDHAECVRVGVCGEE